MPRFSFLQNIVLIKHEKIVITFLQTFLALLPNSPHPKSWPEALNSNIWVKPCSDVISNFLK